MLNMELYSRAAVERAMKVQEVMLHATARKITGLKQPTPRGGWGRTINPADQATGAMIHLAQFVIGKDHQRAHEMLDTQLVSTTGGLAFLPGEPDVFLGNVSEGGDRRQFRRESQRKVVRFASCQSPVATFKHSPASVYPLRDKRDYDVAKCTMGDEHRTGLLFTASKNARAGLCKPLLSTRAPLDTRAGLGAQ
jgi:hypothetical protein